MGCLNDDGGGVGCLDTEFPVHTVSVPQFALSKYEVTFAEWNACVDGVDATAIGQATKAGAGGPGR